MKSLALLLLAAGLLHAAPVSLFDGKSLAGWSVRPGEEALWRVQDGALTGGSLEADVPHNSFLASSKSYQNFELNFKIRLVQGSGFQNSGMQVRSRRNKPTDPEMTGYQVDAGSGYWGDLYDESRRNRALAKPLDPAALAKVVKDWDWNSYRILCEGPRIRTWINGVLAHDYTEAEANIAQDGLLGLQAHGGGRFLVQMKDVLIEELAAPPAAPKPQPDGARTPDEQRAGFKLPEGFSAELVASEDQGVGKPITVAWDRHGRMWTMTALEYPVDANENEAAARALFANGGKDKVLVFDEPNMPGPLTPRVFAKGLAIPLAMLPLADGVLIQHGPELRRYRDNNNDGKADSHEVVLQGFGIQDSHLFPHQLERTPGGWIYVAQGAFNASNVARPNGLTFADGAAAVTFNHCKLGRFKPDGSAFQVLTAGPNNIWGLALARNGETFVQEANDVGHPVAEFAPGTNYPTPFGPRLRDDAPLLPQSTAQPLMGGTGLSGLALADDLGSAFAAGYPADTQVFYLANPITSRIQIVTLTRDSNGHPLYKKQQDFMLSDDPWFRPIAIHFGPDGCLYVVDWYNKIISHNEVPRTHPDRDKSRGRIWRIRQKNQPAPPRVDVAALGAAELLAGLGGPNTRLSSQIWQEIIDRKANDLAPQLAAIIADPKQAIARRLAALWAAEGLGLLTPALLKGLAAAPEHELRFEAVRIAGEASLPEADFLTILSALRDEPHFRVRAAIANALREHRKPSAAMLAMAAQLGREPLAGNSRDVYDRNFERYLARWAMAEHLEATRGLLADKTLVLPAEARLLAVRALPAPEAAAAMVALLAQIPRPLAADELALLGGQLDQPAVQQGFSNILADPLQREPVLQALTRLDLKVAANPQLAAMVATAAQALLAEEPSEARERLVVELARRFRLNALAPQVAAWLQAAQRTPAELANGLATLREAGGSSLPMLRRFLDHADAAVRREALLGFAGADDPAAVAELAERWEALPGALRALAVDGMTANAPKAQAFARLLADGKFPGFDAAAVEKLVATLGAEHPDVAAFLAKHHGLLQPVIELAGKPEGRVLTNLTLDGPFTVEGWVRLANGVSNDDSLLGRRGGDGADMNFHQGRLRLFANKSDQLIAKRVVAAGQWTHCALTRDATGKLALYFDGEPDVQGGNFTAALTGMNLGESNAAGGSAGLFDEIRVWNRARSPEEIRRDFQTRFTAADQPAGLVQRIGASNPSGALEGGAKVSLTRDFPPLVTPAQAATLEEKFAKFRKLASQPGDSTRGQQLAQASCLICHQVKGEGIAVGPNLSGAGAMGVEALLRNILTPNAQLESGYYRHDVKLKDGSTLSGFLSAETHESLTIRQIGADPRVVPRGEILRHDVSRRSLMPEGLIDGFSPQQVADLFSYLMGLK
jgi:putative heme-binding domain-containing protein